MKSLLILMICVMATLSTPLAAQSSNGTANVVELELVQARTLDDLLIQLQNAGYSIDDITRTFLGRIRVLASDATTTREVVMSRTTGEIFSDVVRSREPSPDQAAGRQPMSDNASRADETGARASGGRSEGNGRSDNADSRSNSGGGSRDNGGAGRSNRSD